MTLPAADLVVHEAPPTPGGEPERKAIAGRSPTRIAVDRLRKDPIALICFVTVVLFSLIAIFAGPLCDLFGVSTETVRASTRIDLTTNLPLEGPPNGSYDPEHPFGVAPATGQDNLAVWIYGCQTSLYLAAMAAVFSTVIGVTLGLLAGFLGGVFDAIISFFTDLFLTFPFLLAALALAPIINERFGTDPDKLRTVSFYALVGILVFFGWMGVARLVRGEVLSLREREFVHDAPDPVPGDAAEPHRPDRGVVLARAAGLRRGRGRSLLSRHRRVQPRVLGTDDQHGYQVVGGVPPLPHRAGARDRAPLRGAQPARRRDPGRVRPEDQALATPTDVGRAMRHDQRTHTKG
jgi:ABC-type dipeptide/oligopeptide/nickel transport system permease subunit